MPRPRHTIRRPGLLRRDRRSGLQEGLSRDPDPDPARAPRRARSRRRQGGLDAGTISSAGRDSLAKHGGIDEAAFAKLVERLRYVDGDYNDASTFKQLRQALAAAKRPLHYLAIPPSLFGTVAEHLAQSGCADDARVVIEKPFGHDLKSARELNESSTRRSRNRGSSGSTTTSARSRCSTS